MAQNKYRQGVFVNCPFDAQYKPLFEAVVFALLACDLRPTCALEVDDASEVRIDKIFKIIAECKYMSKSACGRSAGRKVTRHLR